MHSACTRAHTSLPAMFAAARSFHTQPKSSSQLASNGVAFPSVYRSVKFMSTASSPASSPSSPAPTESNVLYETKDGAFEETQLPPSGADRRAFTYFMLGSGKFVYASMVRLIVIRMVGYLSASADVLALSKTEVTLGDIPLGNTLTIKWRGKPVFIRRRKPDEINAVRAVPLSELKDPQKDEDRARDPEWLVVLGVCTHLGCVPLPNAGDYQGWFCPCHGSHYDASGRIRKGPAPLNLEVPQYSIEAGKLVVG